MQTGKHSHFNKTTHTSTYINKHTLHTFTYELYHNTYEHTHDLTFTTKVAAKTE